jgi:hypothetical protein
MTSVFEHPNKSVNSEDLSPKPLRSAHYFDIKQETTFEDPSTRTSSSALARFIPDHSAEHAAAIEGRTLKFVPRFSNTYRN